MSFIGTITCFSSFITVAVPPKADSNSLADFFALPFAKTSRYLPMSKKNNNIIAESK